MIWSGEHLDAARRLQATLEEPAKALARTRPGDALPLPWRGLRPRRPALTGADGA
jgi:hypothetical protein